MNTDDRVREALLIVVEAEIVVIESAPSDSLEEKIISTFLLSGCGCRKLHGKPCYQQFSREYISDYRASCAELTRFELDMAVLGCLAACMNTSSTVSTSARHKETHRVRAYVSFTHMSKPICSKMFQVLHCIGKKRLINLMTSLKENGLAPRVHGNTKRKPKHSLTFHSTEYVVRFLFFLC